MHHILYKYRQSRHYNFIQYQNNDVMTYGCRTISTILRYSQNSNYHGCVFVQLRSNKAYNLLLVSVAKIRIAAFYIVGPLLRPFANYWCSDVIAYLEKCTDTCSLTLFLSFFTICLMLCNLYVIFFSSKNKSEDQWFCYCSPEILFLTID